MFSLYFIKWKKFSWHIHYFDRGRIHYSKIKCFRMKIFSLEFSLILIVCCCCSSNKEININRRWIKEEGDIIWLRMPLLRRERVIRNTISKISFFTHFPKCLTKTTPLSPLVPLVTFLSWVSGFSFNGNAASEGGYINPRGFRWAWMFNHYSLIVASLFQVFTDTITSLTMCVFASAMKVIFQLLIVFFLFQE